MSLMEAVGDLRTRGFSYAGLYLEDPVVVDTLRLSDVILKLNSNHVLARHVLKYAQQGGSCYKFCSGDKIITYSGKEVDSDDVPSITVQVANHVRELLPKARPLSLEDAYFMAIMDENNNGPQKIGESVGHDREACSFFHATYFYTPFPKERDPRDFYKDPTELIEHTIAKEPETAENFAFAEQIMRRLVNFYNDELRRYYIYREKISRGNLSEGEEKSKLAAEIQLNLRGFNNASYLREGREPQPYPSKDFDYDFGGYLLDAWIRSYGTRSIMNPENIVRLGAGRNNDTNFGKKLSQLFREIVTENPLAEYFNPKYMKHVLEDPLQ